MQQYVFRPAWELARLIREGQASSEAIVREHLARIKEHNAKLNAFVSVFESEALETAAERDRQAREGQFLGPLHGVPVSIKEQFWIRGKRSTINAKMHKDFVAPEDAVVVDRIRRSGAVILGQTNVPRYLLDYQVRGDFYADGKNPYNTDCTPGGSTGGGAAAVAAGFSTLELGGDMGGSIRVPSDFCGLYGLKPTEKTIPVYGSVPLRKDARTFIVHMAQAGPLARTAEDVETMWKAIVGPHASDRGTAPIAWREPQKTSLAEYRIAWIDGWPGHAVSRQVSEAIRAFVSRLEQQGCKVENKGPEGNLHAESLKVWMGLLPYIIGQGAPWFVRQMMKIEFRSTFLKGATRYRSEFEKGFRMSANHYGEMMLRRTILIARWERFFENFDFLICPMAFGPAFRRTKVGSKLSYDGTEMIYADYVWPFVACFNASGHPAMNIPLGLGKDGLPLGVQVVGPYWSDPELLAFAKHASAVTEGFVRPAMPE